MGGMGGIFGWAGILVAVVGAYLIFTADKYDPSRLQVGQCSEPTASHDVVYGSHGSLSEAAERSRASRNEESPDLTKKWLTEISTTFTPQTAYATGEDLEGEDLKARRLHFSKELSAGMFEDFEASMEKQQAELLQDRPVGKPDGKCYVFKGVADAWYSTEALATANTQTASSRFTQASATSATPPPVTYYKGLNQVYDVAVAGGDTTTVKFLGTAKDATACADLCVAYSKARCWSFTWHNGGYGSFALQCFGLTAPRWSPTPDASAGTGNTKEVVSGQVQWPCRDDTDCSLNGVCAAGTSTCKCDAPWSGHRCETMDLLPATHGAGYRGVDGGHNTSSWGGAVLSGEDGLYHLWAAEMTEHCGIGAWAQNSRVIHATSATPGGAYVRKDVVYEVFSHEPEVVRAPTGEYVMYFTAQLRSQHGQCNCCGNSSKCDGSTGPHDCDNGGGDIDDADSSRNNNNKKKMKKKSGKEMFAAAMAATPHERRLGGGGEGGGGGGGGGGELSNKTHRRLVGDADPSYMSFASNPNGPWSTPSQMFPDYQGSDTNFAPFLFPDGSLVAIWREWTGRGSRCFTATATDWRNTSTYEMQIKEGELFPDLGTAGTEDPFLYQDHRGNLHAVFHHMYGFNTETQWWLDAVGGHAFSADKGKTWTYSGVAWGDAASTDQGDVVHFTDGSSFRFTRRERPHLVIDEKTKRITHLICAAQYGDGSNPGTGNDNGDASYTLIQPVRQE
eukprot:g1928.t1